MSSTPLFFPSRRSLAAYGPMILLAGAIAGCNCGTRALVSHAPKIEVIPNPVTVANATVGAPGQVTLQVHNAGTLDLVIGKTPYIVDATDGVQFAITNVLVNDCNGTARTTSTPLTIQAGFCAELNLRYEASKDGMFTAKLRFESNDPNHNPYDVPITINALTPHIKACAFDGMTMLGCNMDGHPLALDFGSTPVPMGTTATRTIQLISDGTAPVNVQDMKLSGDPDFTTSPSPQQFPGLGLAPQKTASFTLSFTPTVGGPRTATLSWGTSDPMNQPLVVNITAEASGPALCFCIGTDEHSCEDTTPTMAFGSVGLSSSKVLNLYLNSCGTEPLTFSSATLASGSPEFAPMALPTANTTLPPGMTLTVPVSFTPPAAMAYTGRIVIQTADGEKPFFDLTGTGVHSGCNIQVASNTLDFGQVATNVTARQDYVLANTGTEACTFPMPPAITMGAPPFAIGGYPLQPLQPSHTAKITVTYTPTNSSGQDKGLMAVYYSWAGASTQTLNVNLQGEPTSMPSCKLSTSPNATSMFGGALNFGEVGLNRPKTLPVVIRNIGSATCSISKASVNPGLFGVLPGSGIGPSTAFTIVGQPASTLAPGASTSITVQFLPTQEEQYGSPFGMIGLNVGGPTVQVQTSDKTTFNGSACGGGAGTGAPGCAAWGLSGQGVVSTIQVLPSNLDFGDVTLGCNSAEKTVTIYNVGMSAIHVFGFTLDPAPPPTLFTVIAPPASMSVPITIQPGRSLSIQVKYTPTMLGIQTATLYINSDAAVGAASGSSMSNPYVSVALTGTGVTDSSQTDVFHQLDHQQVDVLWVIDQDANSMGDKQQQIANNTAAFIQAANAAHTDYHLGVISDWAVDAKPEASSNYSNVTVTPATLFNVSAPQAWVQSSDSNPQKEFAQNVMIGTNTDSTGQEGGLQAMFEALSDPIVTGANAGFLRDAASLVVVSISDDDDVNSPYSGDFYAAFLQSLKPSDPQSAIFDTIGGADSNGMPYTCNDPAGDGSDDAPTKYYSVTKATGGKLYNMCTGDWSQIAADLSLGSFGGQTRFVLSRPCDPTTLTVTVAASGGGAVMQIMGTDYTFNTTLNAIDFKTAPPPNSTITATYNALCL